MLLKKNDGRIWRIADYYRFKLQSMVMCEECGELIQAISKYHRGSGRWDGIDDKPIKSTKSYNQIVEEITDVLVMIEQMIYLLDCREQVEQIREEKLQRQICRICEESTDDL